MKKQFVTYEIAIALKELGFDEECFAVWDNQDDAFLNELVYPLSIIKNSDKGLQKYNNFTAPLWQQAIKFINGLLIKIGYYNYSDEYIWDDFNNLEYLEKSILEAIEICRKK